MGEAGFPPTPYRYFENPDPIPSFKNNYIFSKIFQFKFLVKVESKKFLLSTLTSNPTLKIEILHVMSPLSENLVGSSKPPAGRGRGVRTLWFPRESSWRGFKINFQKWHAIIYNNGDMI